MGERSRASDRQRTTDSDEDLTPSCLIAFDQHSRSLSPSLFPLSQAIDIIPSHLLTFPPPCVTGPRSSDKSPFAGCKPCLTSSARGPHCILRAAQAADLTWGV